jgi:glutamate 5-kinase
VVVPVINENDTVVTDEIKFGDNDTLGALVANLVEADALGHPDGPKRLVHAQIRASDPDCPVRASTCARRVTLRLEQMAGGAGSASARAA